MYAIITVEVPDEYAEMVRKFAEYQTGQASTIRKYLDIQLVHLASAFGPECVVDVTDSGTGSLPSS